MNLHILPEKQQDAEIRYLLLLMSVLTQAFFSLVGSHLVSLSFFTAWHGRKI
jgi:hypothetical protein